ncbi:unnamed protein product [Parnassius apollo]|uniref:(apollo) hypothetical protein n=1 Tax=Parnassius apollo TaxID=110799 RepID=A0A8S3XWW5_PARAO|nr:unnamed protein product [Parnassius apollo]
MDPTFRDILNSSKGNSLSRGHERSPLTPRDMFNFFKKKTKAEAASETPEKSRNLPTEDAARRSSVDTRAPRNDNDVTNDNSGTLRKDVVNLLIPEIDYNQKTGVGALLQIMAGKRKRCRKKARADSCRVSPQKETSNLQRSNSDLKRSQDVPPTPAENIRVGARSPSDPADFVKALVLQKYASKPETKQQHVSLVYVSDEPDLDEKRHAEALLREIARSIDCTIDEINENKQPMGNGDSKPDDPVYETVNDKAINSYKNGLKGELDKLLQKENETNNINEEKEDKTETDSLDSPSNKKKSNLKLPKSDTEGCSDDDRSDNGKKRVTFRKHVVFDDGEQQTDVEINSSFESLTSEEEESEYLEDAIPDNDELLGGVVVSREDDNKTVISVSDDNDPIKIRVECFDDGLKRISSDNSDSGFIEISEKTDESNEKSIDVEGSEVSESDSEEEIAEVIDDEEAEESIEEIVETEAATSDDMTTLVTQESKFQSQVAALTELADTRCDEAERARELITAFRKEIEAKDQEIEQLKCDLAAAYKESELVRQRSRSLEEDLAAARSCSADLADQLQRRNDESVRQLRSELEEALTRRAELESKILELERDKERLEQEILVQAQKAQEALAAAEANTAKWRAAHEAARSQAASRAERILADCEWKMRELEKRARDAEKEKKELSQTVEQLQKSPPTTAEVVELQQLRTLTAELQHSVLSLTAQLQQLEAREEALQLDQRRLQDLLDKETQKGKEREEQHLQAIRQLEQQHGARVECLRAEHSSATAAARAHAERAAAERTRAALSQLRAEHELSARAADRRLREVTTRFENLKQELANKEAQYEHAIAEAHSKADWDIMQLRHLLDKADINYANNVERMTEKFEKEKESLTEEWAQKLRAVEEQASIAADEARRLLETTRSKMLAERHEQISKLKEQHRLEMENQWEQFMTDKENCLARMKTECRQEGEEERIKREKELLKEISDLKTQIESKTVDFDNLEAKAVACGQTLAVTEQELREALAREKKAMEKRGEDAAKLKQMEKTSREQIEHLTRKCACLRKLFDDMRARLAARERSAEQEARAREKELHYLRAEVARLTKILVEQSSPKLGTRTRADGCENVAKNEESFFSRAAPLASETQQNAPRRKGGTLRTPELVRKRPTLPELQPLPPEARRATREIENGRRRAKSVDLPAVQVPIRIKQLEQKTKE